jgi:hypothetical protein
VIQVWMWAYPTAEAVITGSFSITGVLVRTSVPTASLYVISSKVAPPQGPPLLAETLFGWGRQTVALGLAERRTGFMCLGAQSACSGRKRWEDRHQQAAAALRQLAEAHAQQDPTFRPSLTYTRLTAQAALQALSEQGYSEEQLPSPSTMAEVLNRMGFRLRKVVKAKPQKKLKETDAIFDNIKKR